MEIRKMQIRPEDECRLRELLKIHEAAIDSLSDEELDAVEEQTSQRLQKLLKKPGNPTQNNPVLQGRFPLKTGTMAFLAAAAVMLFVQMQGNETMPNPSNMITKGNSTSTQISCSVFIVDRHGAAPAYIDGLFVVQGDQESRLKIFCGEAMFVHVGYAQGEMLHLVESNLKIPAAETILMLEGKPMNLTPLAAKKSGLTVLVTEQELDKKDLTPADLAGLWFEEISLSVKR
jgi:hypothetical protein